LAVIATGKAATRAHTGACAGWYHPDLGV